MRVRRICRREEEGGQFRVVVFSRSVLLVLRSLFGIAVYVFLLVLHLFLLLLRRLALSMLDRSSLLVHRLVVSMHNHVSCHINSTLSRADNSTKMLLSIIS